MKNNRRDFIKKSASLAAAVSVGGINSAILIPSGENKKPVKSNPTSKMQVSNSHL